MTIAFPRRSAAILVAATTCLMLVSVPATTAGASGSAGSGCTISVSPGGGVQAALSKAATGAVICLASGTYSISTPLVPKSGQSIRGSSSSRPVLKCSGSSCFDGANTSHVTLSYLILQGAKGNDINAGAYWTMSNLDVGYAGTVGIMVVKQRNVQILNSYVHNTGQFAILVIHSLDTVVKGTTVAYSPTKSSVFHGYAGGLKSNETVGLTVQGSTFHNIGAGGALWMDINSRYFKLSGNTFQSNGYDGIRIEISCHGTVSGNTVSSSRRTAINVVNSREVTVSSNTVSGSGANGIRFLENGRRVGQGGTGGHECATNGAYPTLWDKASYNLITFGSGVLNGIMRTAGWTGHNAFVGNGWVASCTWLNWRWWNGHREIRYRWRGWRYTQHQDTGGYCS